MEDLNDQLIFFSRVHSNSSQRKKDSDFHLNEFFYSFRHTLLSSQRSRPEWNQNQSLEKKLLYSRHADIRNTNKKFVFSIFNSFFFLLALFQLNFGISVPNIGSPKNSNVVCETIYSFLLFILMNDFE
ncbi:hypothetical protein NH340_JMT03700 [Sarcoptes scabiei]|nr:hypothetical protein NH340_JMT03700 [Sarcoptes scabiei]